MLIFSGTATALVGLFLLLWYRVVVSLPDQRRPRFLRNSAFKWGIPAASILLLLAGLSVLGSVSIGSAVALAAFASLFSFLTIKFDKHSAQMRMIRDHYLRLRRANPDMDELEALFCTAQWRYPEWSNDRVVELVAGKNLEGLILLMLVQENGVNPLSDWELYRSLKLKAARIVADKGASSAREERKP
jgi:hypothetical protein